MKTAVVFVHGLFLNGAEFGLLRRRLAAAHGFQSHRFSYSTVRGSMEATLERLERFVERIDAERVHFVGHSLGGIVLHRYFQDFPGSQASRARAGRVLLLGAPLAGSASARAVAKHALLRRVIGPLVGAELVRECSPRQWSCGCELGLIAGSRPLGLGRFFARFQEDCDGTVAVSETRLPGHTAHLTLPVSHMGMLVDAKVARQAGTFLSEGRFEPV
jgi:pimeloyl-ACP methyl ester carboxylesterase